MVDLPPIDYSALDRPEIAHLIFHPRSETGSFANTLATDIYIPVGEEISVGARFHLAGKEAPNIIFFHGNGEIVSDYDDLGPVYNRMGINFLNPSSQGRFKNIAAMVRMANSAKIKTRIVAKNDDRRAFGRHILIIKRISGNNK